MIAPASSSNTGAMNSQKTGVQRPSTKPAGGPGIHTAIGVSTQ